MRGKNSSRSLRGEFPGSPVVRTPPKKKLEGVGKGEGCEQRKKAPFEVLVVMQF